MMSTALELTIPHTLRSGATAALREAIETRVDSVTIHTPQVPDETADAIERADVVATMGFEDGWYDRLDGVSLVQALSAGVDHYDLEALAAKEVALTNASGVHSEPISQQVLGYMLAFERNLHRAMHQQARGVWERFRAGELGGKTLGIVGVGAIGEAVARVVDPFDMTVIGTKRDTSVDLPHVDELYPPADLDRVLARSDYLVLACPLTDETRGLIDAEALGLLPSDAVLINIARGPVVDESALVEALQQRRIRGAGLDVFETEPLPSDSTLWDLSNVIITPHMAGSTPAYYDRCGEILATNIDAVATDDLDGLTNRVV